MQSIVAYLPDITQSKVQYHFPDRNKVQSIITLKTYTIKGRSQVLIWADKVSIRYGTPLNAILCMAKNSISLETF